MISKKSKILLVVHGAIAATAAGVIVATAATGAPSAVPCKPDAAGQCVVTIQVLAPAPAPVPVPPPAPAPVPVPVPPPALVHSGTIIAAPVTWYSAPDNDPAGSRSLAYPGASPRHAQAGGTGTYEDPQSFASHYRATYPIGTRIYVPRVKRYYVLEDDCHCPNQPANHVDLWLEPSGTNAAASMACEDALTHYTPSGNTEIVESIVKNPDPYREVDLTPLISDDVCRVP